MGIKNLLVLFIVSIVTFCANAQEVVKIDGKKYVVHVVEQGQTLYAISKKYGAKVDDIIAENPGVEKGLSIGQSVRIPYSDTDKKVLKQDNLTIEGDTLFHEVVKGETLYSISKRYFLSIEDIAQYNPELQDGLKIGMRLIIPYHLSLEARPKDVQVAEADSLLLHTVEAGQTLYSLSKQYNVSIDSIQIVNNGLQEGLKVGTTIRLPLLNPEFNVIRPVEQDTMPVVEHAKFEGEQLRVAILAPFFLAANDTIDSIHYRQPYLPKSEVAIQFAMGTRLALDSLVALGCRLKVNYFDESDEMVLDSLVQDSLAAFDVVLGPFYRSNFIKVSDVLQARGVPVISPVSITSKTLLSRPSTYKVYPSVAAHLQSMAKNMVHHYRGRRMVLIQSGRAKDNVYCDLMVKYLNKELIAQAMDSVEVWDSRSRSMSDIANQLEEMKEVVLAIPSQDQAYVSRLLTQINDTYLDADSLNLVIYGMPKWLGYDNIDYSTLVNLHVHYSTLQDIDFKRPTVIQFTKEFREQNHTDPNAYAFIGFDMCLSHLQWLWENKSISEDLTYEGLSMDIRYLNMGETNGKENQKVQVVEYNNYQKVNRTVHDY